MNRIRIKIFFCLLIMLRLHSEAWGQIQLAVLPFVSRSNEVSALQASQVTDMVIRNLHSSPSILIIERERLKTVAAEQGFNFSSGILNQDTAVRIGSIIGCQYILFGAVTQVTERYITKSVLLAAEASKETIAILEARIIDVATRMIVLSVSKSGSSLEKLKKRSYSSNTRRFAMEFAASRLCDNIREVLADEYPAVISVNENQIRINRGRSSGVNTGALYRVYQEGKELFGSNDQSLGKRPVNLAILRVVNVNSEFSTAEVLDCGIQASAKSGSKTKRRKSTSDVRISRLIHEGDKLEAVSFSEAEKIKLTTQRIGG